MSTMPTTPTVYANKVQGRVRVRTRTTWGYAEGPPPRSASGSPTTTRLSEPMELTPPSADHEPDERVDDGPATDVWPPPLPSEKQSTVAVLHRLLSSPAIHEPIDLVARATALRVAEEAAEPDCQDAVVAEPKPLLQSRPPRYQEPRRSRRDTR